MKETVGKVIISIKETPKRQNFATGEEIQISSKHTVLVFLVVLAHIFVKMKQF